MVAFPLLYTVGFLSFLYFGIYIFAQEKRDKKSQLFLASCLGFAFWNLAYAGMSVTHEQYHDFFQKLGYLGASWYEPFLLLFIIHIVSGSINIFSRRRVKTIILAVIFIFPAVLTWQNLMYNAVAEGFPNGFWHIAHHIYANVYNGVAIFLLFLWRSRTSSEREKRQALVLILGAFAAIISTLITDFTMGNAGLPTLTPFLTLIWGGCIFFAFSRFKFMKTAPLFISTEILTQSPDLAILFDRNLELLYSNRNEILGKIDFSRIQKKPGIEDFFEDGEQLLEKIKTLITGESKVITAPVALKLDPEKRVPFQGRFSLITDEYDTFGGVLFSGRSLISSDRFGRKWGLTPREQEVLALLASGKTNGSISKFLGIAERTVKSHIGSMLLKTKTKSRLELVQLFNSDRFSSFP